MTHIKKFSLYTFLFFFASPIFVLAANTTKDTASSAYTQCKRGALVRKEARIAASLQKYRIESTFITNTTHSELEAIKWRIYSGYRPESKRIFDEQKQKMTGLHTYMVQTKEKIDTTWKAEDSLCDFIHNKSINDSSIKIKH